MNGRLPHSTILGNLAKEKALNADHPLFYTKERTHYLDRLTEEINVQTELPTVDLRRNMRIDYYMNQYNHVRSEHQKEVRIKNTLLKSKEFHSIFQEDELKKRSEARNVKESKSIQENLYRNYVEEGNFYQPPERDQPNKQDQPETILTLGDENRLKQLYLIDLEIGKLKYEEQLDKIVKQRHESCQNNALIGKLSSSIISSYMVYFDQIYALLIDELLEEEVIYLNHIEAEYKVTNSMPLPKTQLESRQTIQMMQLVKSLQDLCDD